LGLLEKNPAIISRILAMSVNTNQVRSAIPVGGDRKVDGRRLDPLWIAQNRHIGIFRRQILSDNQGSIGAATVNNDDLKVKSLIGRQ